MVLVQKCPLFQLVSFGNIRQENVFYDILERKTPFYAIKTRSSISPKIAIFPSFFLRNIRQEHVFYDILERKDACLGYKNKKLKKSKNWHFSKGVNPWFFSKIAIFPTFFNCNVGQENVFCDILEQKDAFLGFKNNKLKNLEINTFPNGLTHGFGPKMAIFQISFFLAI